MALAELGPLGLWMTLVPEGEGRVNAAALGTESLSALLANGQAAWLLTPVPEPGSTWALFTLGLSGLTLLGWRRAGMRRPGVRDLPQRAAG